MTSKTKFGANVAQIDFNFKKLIKFLWRNDKNRFSNGFYRFKWYYFFLLPGFSGSFILSFRLAINFSLHLSLQKPKTFP